MTPPAKKAAAKKAESKAKDEKAPEETPGESPEETSSPTEGDGAAGDDAPVEDESASQTSDGPEADSDGEQDSPPLEGDGDPSSTFDTAVPIREEDRRIDQIVVRLDGTVSGDLYDEENAEVYVRVKREVLEEFHYPGTKRPSYRVLFTAGQIVPKSRIDALNARNADSTAAELDAAGDGGQRLQSAAEPTEYAGLASLEKK